MKHIVKFVFMAVFLFMLSGCGCEHEWADANCTAPRTCSLCSATEGDALGHSWQDATCTAPKTCSACQLTEGNPTEHQWQEATTEAPETCILCNQTTGSKLETDPRFTTKSTKDLHGTWICDVMMTDEMMGLVNFGGLECQMQLTFGKTGEMTVSLDAKDEGLVMQKLKTYTINTLYETFGAQGMSKADVDKMMLDTYGMSVVAYVDDALKDYDLDAMFAFAKAEQVYYVDGNKIYTAEDWKSVFEGAAFTLNGNQLIIEGLTLEEGAQDLVWNRA